MDTRRPLGRFERDLECSCRRAVALRRLRNDKVRVGSISVRYKTNSYSVPIEYGHHQVLVKA